MGRDGVGCLVFDFFASFRGCDRFLFCEFSLDMTRLDDLHAYMQFGMRFVDIV